MPPACGCGRARGCFARPFGRARELQREITTLVEDKAPQLLELAGCGALTAAKILAETARTFLAKKETEGKTRREALRALKRHLARVVWRALQQAAQDHEPPGPGPAKRPTRPTPESAHALRG